MSRRFLLIFLSLTKFRISNKSVFGIPGFVVTQHCGTTTSVDQVTGQQVTSITRTGPGSCNRNLWKGDDNPIKYNRVSINVVWLLHLLEPLHFIHGSVEPPDRGDKLDGQLILSTNISSNRRQNGGHGGAVSEGTKSGTIYCGGGGGN